MSADLLSDSVIALALQAISQPDLATLLQLKASMQQALLSAGALAYVVFFLIYVTLTALCLPGGSVLMLVGGACMGFVECLLLSNTACTLGAWLTFVGVRTGFQRHQPDMAWLRRVEAGLEGHQIAFLLSIRLAPIIPFALFNILAGLAHVGHWRFLWTSFAGMLPGTVLYINAGSQLGQVNSLSDLIAWDVMLSIAALALLPWLCSVWMKSQTDRLQS